MKRILLVIVAVIFATLFIPFIIVSLLSGTNETAETVSVYIKSEDRVEEMEIDEYLTCVVAAEMPADFENEALKAQAVAARTYLYSHIEAAENGNIPEEHNGAVICTDSTHCQAYISEEERKKSWGGGADSNWKKIEKAVDGTKNQIMTYNSEPISAVFHSTSSGRTERAADVWGEDIPYLQSVESEGDLYSPKYISEVHISVDDFKRIISEKVPDADWSGELFGNISRSEAGGILTIDVGNRTIKGTEFRSILGLNSSNVEISERDGEITMSVKGYGHGVGMSQYGANYLASQGEGYEEILKTYYTGVEIETRLKCTKNKKKFV
ncbi:MAG: stage II sporulation protein D [Oscillospiraceae bacterium]|nr:stage II sporulation protein D [Oscillospiraceae bacterium]